ncbi:hypothetical protein OS493_023544 [Desmophyllum pertusum]|uniref:Endonuclease V n=1 Tax=Desmophyllum pertusum TaxID=174260 RepID=A0A9X0CW80_9CNID|nr:hypothetical protein OS493_023544 [Desmophyllum pertusum]
MASRDTVENDIVETWKREQIELKKKLVSEDCVNWGVSTEEPFSNLNLIGGVDISFPKGDADHACACLVVLNFPELEVVYEDLSMVHLTSPYVPEYLAFREVGFLVDLISRLGKDKPELLPQVILVDGNGMLHPRGFGIACHLGVLTDIPTVGVAKTLFHVDGIERDSYHADQALRSTQQACNPIYVSVGHKIGLETAVSLTHACCQYRIPEPIRQADIRSREYLRQHYTKELNNCSCKMQSSDTDASTEDKDDQRNRGDLVDNTCQTFNDLKLS